MTTHKCNHSELLERLDSDMYNHGDGVLAKLNRLMMKSTRLEAMLYFYGLGIAALIAKVFGIV